MSTRIARWLYAITTLILITIFISPATANTLGACVKNNSGNIKMADSAADCKNSEYFVSWNVQGIQGIQGIQGPAGADSTVAGPAGPAGSRGPEGDPSTDTLDSLSCMDGETAISDGTGWSCGSPEVSVVDPLIADLLARVVALEDPATYAIGDTGEAGGIVFYITDGGLHGLEAARVDQASAQWCTSHTDIIGVDNNWSFTTVDSHSGLENTPLIVDVCGPSSAAGVAANHVWPDGQTGGFLPNKEEIHLLAAQKAVVGGFAPAYYWSSSEADDSSAWLQGFANGDRKSGPDFDFKGYPFRVRAVRAF